MQRFPNFIIPVPRKISFKAADYFYNIHQTGGAKDQRKFDSPKTAFKPETTRSQVIIRRASAILF